MSQVFLKTNGFMMENAFQLLRFQLELPEIKNIAFIIVIIVIMIMIIIIIIIIIIKIKAGAYSS